MPRLQQYLRAPAISAHQHHSIHRWPLCSYFEGVREMLSIRRPDEMHVFYHRRALPTRTVSQYFLHRLSGGRRERAVEGTQNSIIRLQLPDQMLRASIVE